MTTSHNRLWAAHWKFSLQTSTPTALFAAGQCVLSTRPREACQTLAHPWQWELRAGDELPELGDGEWQEEWRVCGSLHTQAPWRRSPLKAEGSEKGACCRPPPTRQVLSIVSMDGGSQPTSQPRDLVPWRPRATWQKPTGEMDVVLISSHGVSWHVQSDGDQKHMLLGSYLWAVSPGMCNST